MALFLLDTLKTFPTSFWHVFGAFLGLSSVTTPIAIAFLIVNSGTINYSAGGTQIMLEGKRLNRQNEANLSLLEAQLESQKQTILQLTDAARKKNLEGKLKPELNQLQKEAEESQNRLEAAQESQEDLSIYVESAIAP